MKKIPALFILGSTFIGVAACGSNNSGPAVESPSSLSSPSSETTPQQESPFISAALGEPIEGYDSPVDLAIRPGDQAQTFIAEQGGLIREIQTDGSPGRTVADLTESTEARGEQGLLGLAFDLTGERAFVNYTDLEGNTTVDQFNIDDDGTFLVDSRRTIYTLTQPYRNHNGGDLLILPDGKSLLVFTGDGGSAKDPERRALDPTSDLGKIIHIDISTDEFTSRLWARGLRNPWRASYDVPTGHLWIADVGEYDSEEINVVPLDRSQGVSFGWSAFEGNEVMNDDQLTLHQSLTAVEPVYTYPHENDDCSISGGYVYRGSGIPHLGNWYFFTDWCSGVVRALCVTDDDTTGVITPCGVATLGTATNPVAILPDAMGQPWVLSQSGSITPIVPENS
jgi:glucose/arabinose dehydrogenase